MENVTTTVINESSDSCTVAADERPLSPVLNSSGSSQKEIFGRKRSRLKTKVNLIDRFSLEQTPPSVSKTKHESLHNLLTNPKLLDDLNVSDKIKKIKEIEEARRKFANHFYINQKSLNESNTNTEVHNTLSAFNFKKPNSPISRKQVLNSDTSNNQKPFSSLELEQIAKSKVCDKANFGGFRTGSGKEVIVSLDSIKKHSSIFKDILTPLELNENLSKLNLNPKISNNFISQDVKKSQMKDTGNKSILQTSITDTQFNLAGDIAISVDFESWADAEFDTSIITDEENKNLDLNKTIATSFKCEDDFKGFDEPITENKLGGIYTTLIKHIEKEISLILNKMNFPIPNNKRSLSSFTTNPSKRFKFDAESSSHLTSTNLMYQDNDSISEINELELETKVHFKSEDLKPSNIPKDDLDKNCKDDLSEDLISIKHEFSSTTSADIKSIKPMGFQTASGKGIKISNKAWSRVSSILQEANLPDFDKSKSRNKERYPINKTMTLINNENVTPNQNHSKSSYSSIDGLNPTSLGSTVENKPMGFQSVSGKSIQISNKALSTSNKILQEENLPNLKESNLSKKGSPHKPFNESADTWSKSCNNREESSVIEKTIKTTTFMNGNSNAGANFYSGFSSAAGKKIEISSKAWNKASNILKEDNLPAVNEKQIKCSDTLEGSSHQASGKNVEISNKASCIFQKENLPHVAEHEIKKEQSIKTCLYDNLPSMHINSNNPVKEEKLSEETEKEFKNNLLLGNTIYPSGNMSGGFTSAGGKSISVSKEALMKANNLLSEGNLIKIEDKSQDFSRNVNKDLKLSFGDLNNASLKKEVPSVSRRNTVQTNNPNVVPKMRMRRIPFQSPIKVSVNENSCKESKFNPVKEESIVNDLHVPKNDVKIATKSNRKRLGISGFKQIVIDKEKLQRASLIFEESEDEKLTSTSIYSSTPVKKYLYSSASAKKCDVTTKPNIETFKNENNCLSNVNITPIRNSNTFKDVRCVEIETKIDLLQDQDGAVIFKKRNTLNSLEHINQEYQSLEIQLQNLLHKKQVLESQRGFLTNKDCSHISPRRGVLTKKKFSPQRTSWSQYLENVEPGSMTTREALKNGVSNVVLAISPNNANDTHFNCERNDPSKSVIHTEDGAIVVSNSNNLIGLTEIITAFEVMPGVEAKLLPRNWISNHFKWIVWKLASLERNFPDKFANFLCVENVIQQLKYRYDREIDNAERPALRKILEKDDVPQKKMVLCVAAIIDIAPGCFELELTDGWYSIRTIIDGPLCKQVKKEKIVVGTKLVTQCSELLNCDDGCHPLEVSDNVRLKIFYNCTRRAKWNLKLGYQRILEPFPIALHTILPDGGCIGCIKVFIARVYPVRYMEKEANGRTVLRNKRAEDKKAQEWETERAKEIEAIQYKVQRDYEAETSTDVSKRKISLDKQYLVEETHSPKDLCEMLENDPENFNSALSSDQLAQIMDYKMNFHRQQQQKLASRMDMELKNLKCKSRNVTPVLKLCVTELNENNEQSEIGYTFNIYKPSEEHLQSITEGSTFTIYNVLPKQNGELVANNKTNLKLESTLVKNNKMSRSVIPIAALRHTKKPMFNEYDTIGTIVQLLKNDNSQNIWLTDSAGNLLLVKVVIGSDKCSLLDNLSRGHSIAIMNLVFCTLKYNFEQAIANHCTLVTRYPRHRLLQEHLLEHCNQLPKDLTHLMNECDKKIEKFQAVLNTSVNYKNSSANSLFQPTNLRDLFDDSYEDTTEIAMSLIDMDQYFDNSNR